MSKQKLGPPRPLARNRAVLAYIHPGQTSAFFTNSMLGLVLYDRANGQHVAELLNEWSSTNVSQARNGLVERFLTMDAEWLLFIDTDMDFGPDALEALLRKADPEKAPVVGGLCFGETGGLRFPTIYQMAELDGRPVTMRMHDYPRDAMVQVAATGAAFLLIHRRVLEGVRDKAFNAVFPWFQETELAGLPCGEDLTFCLRAQICGFPVWVNTAVKTGHHKSHLLTEELYLAQQSSN